MANTTPYIQLIHAFTLTLGYIGAATLMDMESSQQIRFSAQAFYSTFILNNTAIIGAVLGGQIRQHWGYIWLYLIAGILSLTGAIIMAIFVRPPQSQ